MMWMARDKAEQNAAVLDPWSVVHFGIGMAAGLVDAPATVAFGGALIYDIAEQGVERTGWGQQFFKTSGPESLGNVLGDIAVFGIGYYLGRKWNRHGV